MDLHIPEGYSVRAATPEDLPAILALCNACDLADIGAEETDLDWFENDWRRPRFDPSTDTWLVSAPDGSPAAYSQTWDEIEQLSFDSNGWVLPEYRGRGLGTFLVRAVERRAGRDATGLPSGSAPKIYQTFADGLTDAEALMHSFGYRQERTFQHMSVALEGGIEVDVPEGFTIRAYRPGEDDRALHAAEAEAFADHWGDVPRSFQEWAGDWFGSKSFDPSLWLIGENDGQIAGLAFGIVQAGRGWVSDLGVRPAWRRRGLGDALLRSMFALFAARGLTEVRLNVDSDNATGATHMYERAGMSEIYRWIIYAKVLTGLA